MTLTSNRFCRIGCRQPPWLNNRSRQRLSWWLLKQLCSKKPHLPPKTIIPTIRRTRAKVMSKLTLSKLQRWRQRKKFSPTTKTSTQKVVVGFLCRRIGDNRFQAVQQKHRRRHAWITNSTRKYRSWLTRGQLSVSVPPRVPPARSGRQKALPCPLSATKLAQHKNFKLRIAMR